MSSSEVIKPKIDFRSVFSVVAVIVIIAIVTLISANHFSASIKKNFWDDKLAFMSEDLKVQALVNEKGSTVSITSPDYVSADVFESALNTLLDEFSSNSFSSRSADRFMLNFGQCDYGVRCIGFEFMSEDLNEDTVSDALAVYSLIEEGDSPSDFGVVFSTNSRGTTVMDDSGRILLVSTNFDVERWVDIIETKNSLIKNYSLSSYLFSKTDAVKRIDASDVNSSLDEEKLRTIDVLNDVIYDGCYINYNETVGIEADCYLHRGEKLTDEVRKEFRSSFPTVNWLFREDFENPQEIDDVVLE